MTFKSKIIAIMCMLICGNLDLLFGLSAMFDFQVMNINSGKAVILIFMMILHGCSNISFFSLLTNAFFKSYLSVNYDSFSPSYFKLPFTTKFMIYFI